MTPTRTALVTGANRGLGRQVSHDLVAQGWRVILTARKAEVARSAAASVSGPVPAESLELNVADDASVSRAASALQGRTIDLLINNAGVYPEDGDPDGARRTVDVDFFGPLRVTMALLPLIPAGGHVVMVSSGLGELTGMPQEFRTRLTDPALTRDGLAESMCGYMAMTAANRLNDGWPGSPYGAAKAALNALVRLLSVELAGRKIRVNAVCPGWVRTDMGGAGASRSVEEGAASILATALDPKANGGFFRDGRPIVW